MIDGEVSRGEKMLESGTDPESYITEYTLVYEDKVTDFRALRARKSLRSPLCGPEPPPPPRGGGQEQRLFPPLTPKP